MLSKWYKEQILKNMLKARDIPGIGNLYLGLAIGEPGTDDAVTEPGYSEYRRVEIEFNAAINAHGRNGNSNLFDLPTPAGGDNFQVENAKYFVIFDARVRGHLIFYGRLRNAQGPVDIPIHPSMPIKIGANALSIELKASESGCCPQVSADCAD